MKPLNRRQFLTTLALSGTVAALAACGQNQAPTTSANDDATSQFLTDRNNGTPVAVGENTGGMLPGGRMIGIVQEITDDDLTIKRPMEGSTARVALTDDTQIYKQIEGGVGDISIGDAITAFGTKSGEVYEAQNIQIGGTMNGPVIIGRPAQGMDGQAPSSDSVVQQANSSVEDQPVSGTVAQINGDTLTVNTNEGTATIKLGSNGVVQKRGEVDRSEIVLGQMIMVSGEQNGELFTASEIELLPAPDVP